MRFMNISDLSDDREKLDKVLPLLANGDQYAYLRSSGITHTKIVNYESDGPSILDPNTVQNDDPSDSLIFGQLVDTLVTDADKFMDSFYILPDDVNFSPSEKRLFNELYNYGVSLTDYSVDSSPESIDYLLGIVRGANYFSHYKDDTLYKNVLGLIKKYNYYSEGKYRHIITSEQYLNAVKCVEALYNSPITSRFFKETNDVSIYHQVVITDQDLKCKFDILYIDHANKKIYPIDLKTTGDLEINFAKSFKKFKYYRQAELYMKLLLKFLEKNKIGYSVEPFRFMVINKESLTPLLFVFPIEYIVNDYGKTVLKISKYDTVNPIDKVIDEIRWYYMAKQYKYPKDVYIKLCEQQSLDDHSEIIDINLI